MSTLPISGQKRPFEGPTPQPNKRPKQAYPADCQYNTLLRRYVIARSPSAQNVRQLIQFTRNIKHCHKRIGQKLDSDLEERVFHFFQEFIILVKKPFRKHTPQDISPKVTQGRLIYTEMLHTYYRNNKSEWDKLEPKRRKFFVDTFCNQDLPVIEIPPKGYNGRCAISKFSKETKNRIQWHGECASKGGQYTVEQLFDLNFALQDHGLPMRWSSIYELSEEITMHALEKHKQGDPGYTQMLYRYFTENLTDDGSIGKLHECFQEQWSAFFFPDTDRVWSHLLILFFKADLPCSAELEFKYVSDDFSIRFIELYGSLSKPTANQKEWLELFIEEFCETDPEKTFVINEKLNESGIPMVWTDGINPEILECAKTKPEYERLLCSYFKSLGDEAFSFESLDELVENFYKRYSQDVKAWQQLDNVKRTALVELFYSSSKPVISLYKAPVDPTTLKFESEFSELSCNQLLWHRENVSYIGNHMIYLPESMFRLNKRLVEKDLPDAWNFEITSEVVEYTIIFTEWAEHLNTYLSQTFRKYSKADQNSPWARMEPENCTKLVKLFFDKDLPFFGGDRYYSWCFNVEFSEISKLSKNQLEWYCDSSIEGRTDREILEVNLARKNHKLSPVWPKGGITRGLINEAKGQLNYEKLLHSYFVSTPIEFKAKQGSVFDVGDMFNGNPIPEPSTEKVTPDVIRTMRENYVGYWNTYFQNETEKWTNLSKEQVTAFVSRFSQMSLPVLPLDSVEIVRKQLDVPPMFLYLKAAQIDWLLAIHDKLGNFLTEPERIMLIRDYPKT